MRGSHSEQEEGEGGEALSQKHRKSRKNPSRKGKGSKGDSLLSKRKKLPVLINSEERWKVCGLPLPREGEKNECRLSRPWRWKNLHGSGGSVILREEKQFCQEKLIEKEKTFIHPRRGRTHFARGGRGSNMRTKPLDEKRKKGYPRKKPMRRWQGSPPLGKKEGEGTLIGKKGKKSADSYPLKYKKKEWLMKGKRKRGALEWERRKLWSFGTKGEHSCGGKKR